MYFVLGLGGPTTARSGSEIEDESGDVPSTSLSYFHSMVGDRLYTDIEMARRAGIMSVLVLTGEAKKADLRKTRLRADFVFESIAELAAVIAQ